MPGFSLFSQADLGAFKQLVNPDREPTPILFIGSYHMSNPGADQFNVEADDVLVPKRQLEIQEVVELLKVFRPTKIAVESPKMDTLTQMRYQGYVRNKLSLRRNEEEQIGFRLAKELDHSTIYPVDVKLNLDDGAISKLVEENPEKFGVYLSRLQKVGSTAVSTIGDWLHNGTIREVLYNMNHPDIENISHQLYFYSFMPIVEKDNYAGASLVSNWYERNLKIFSNINEIASDPEDRILVIYGQGHIPLLKQFARDSPYFTVVNAIEYLEK